MTNKANSKNFIKPVILIIVLISFLGVMFWGSSDPEIIISKDSAVIKGMYGLEARFEDIEEITLIEKSMKEIGIGRRTNGFDGFGIALKGYFSSGELGDTILFVRPNSSPTIKIKRKTDKDIYISLKDSHKTRRLYENLRSALDK
ncbi:MAG TPA: hypothetical protein VIL03_04745 [Clostridia bacterium]|jgi:hypothetical protein